MTAHKSKTTPSPLTPFRSLPSQLSSEIYKASPLPPHVHQISEAPTKTTKINSHPRVKTLRFISQPYQQAQTMATRAANKRVGRNVCTQSQSSLLIWSS